MFPRLTHDCEVDLGLLDAQLALHHQCVAATVLLACCQDGELAAALTVLYLDVLALLDLQVEVGVKKGGSSTLYSQGWAWVRLLHSLFPRTWGREQGLVPFVYCGAYL